MNDERKKELRSKPFPIQGTTGKRDEPPTTIPWWLAEVAYEHYVRRFGNIQSLERIAERHGFGRAELISLIRRE